MNTDRLTASEYLPTEEAEPSIEIKTEVSEKSYAVWEDSVEMCRSERKFFRYCLLRQPSLFRFVFIFMIYGFLRYFGIVSREKYLCVRWSFLSSVKDLDLRLKKYARSRVRRLFFPVSPIHVISEHPTVYISAFCKDRGIDFTSNEYCAEKKAFTDFKSKEELFSRESAKFEGELCLYGAYPSRISRKAKKCGVRFIPVFGKRQFRCRTTCLLHRILYTLFTVLLLISGMVAVGIAGLYFAGITNDFTVSMFESYFEIPNLVLLNVLPGVFLVLLLYFITNSSGVAFAVSSVLVLLLNFINYYKLLFRNDPFIAEDITLVSEAAGISERYSITLGGKMAVTVICVLCGILVFFSLFRGKIHLPKVRPIMSLVLAVLGIVGFNRVYLSSDIYDDTENLKYINQWSDTQQFISRGFMYPFLYSFSYLSEGAPEGYDEEYARGILESYTYEAIPEDKKVNILSVMLEAYTDFTEFSTLDFTSDPYEFWHSLQKEAYSGHLISNVFAGGTINTERAFLSGYANVPSFRARTNTHVRYLADQGYYAEGSHPGNDWFYNRKNVNEFMGFEKYFFSEDTYAELFGTDRYPATDSVLFPNIRKLFDQSLTERPNTPYFSFNVTYQGHGPYDDTQLVGEEYVRQGELEDSAYFIINNYLDSMNKTDQVLEEWVTELRDIDEPVILVLFGDHKPWMGSRNSALISAGVSLDLSEKEGFENYYSTPYLIWANDSARRVLDRDFTGEGETFSACFLMNKVFELAGWRGNEYMQFLSDVKNVLPVIHTSNRFYVDGELKSELPSEAQKVYDDFRKVQYYVQKNFNES